MSAGCDGPVGALQGDRSAEIRKEALRLVQLEDEKHPTFLNNRLLEGVEMTVAFQMRTIGAVHPLEDITMQGQGGGIDGDRDGTDVKDRDRERDREKVSVFGPLYASCIQPSRKRRNDFIIGLLRRALQITQLIRGRKSTGSGAGTGTAADAGSSYGSSNDLSYSRNNTNAGKLQAIRDKERAREEASNTDPASGLGLGAGAGMGLAEALRLFTILSFLLTTLAHLPFDYAEEALQAIYWVGRNVPLTAGRLLGEARGQLLGAGAQARVAAAMQPPALGSRPLRAGAALCPANTASSVSAADSLSAGAMMLPLPLPLFLISSSRLCIPSPCAP